MNNALPYVLQPAGMGQSALEATVSNIADRIVDAVLPRLTPIVQQAAEAAEPTIRTVVKEEVVPQMAIYGLGGIALVGLIGAAVGSWFASRG
jgi:hypothetical protein